MAACYLVMSRSGKKVPRAALELPLRTMSSDSKNVLTNGGTIEGVWVFTRHGDRTPSRPLCASHMVDTEAAFWRTKLPQPESAHPFKVLTELFPAEFHPSNGGQFQDVLRYPFGFLTRVGVDQLQRNGKRFFIRYDHYGHHCDLPPTDRRGNRFLDSWEVKAYSTNYLRTVTSVQCFLDGLLGTNLYTHPQGQESTEEEEIPHHDTATRPEQSDGQVSVVVRDRTKDILNAFDRRPDLMMSLVSRVVDSASFIERDAVAAPLAARLANFLPGLTRKGRKTFGGPSAINWIDASDHFVCRSAHSVKYSRFSAFEHDDRVEQTMSAMAHQTIAHLSWRFRQWYQYAPLLAELAAPPLREILSQMTDAVHLPKQERHPFVVYSCHDVTILGLLYAIGADFLGDEDKGEWRFWPAYATTLVFELVRIGNENERDTHVVRVLLNGKAIISANLVDLFSGKVTDIEYVGNGPSRMLRLADFEEVVKQLEGFRVDEDLAPGSSASDEH